MIHAAEAHKSLIESAHNLNAGLDAALRTLATLSPLMQELKTKKKYRTRAKAYLDAERFAQLSQMAGMRSIEKSSRLTELVEKGENSKELLKDFLNIYSRSFEISPKGLQFWLRDELDLRSDGEESAWADGDEEENWTIVNA